MRGGGYKDGLMNRFFKKTLVVWIVIWLIIDAIIIAYIYFGDEEGNGMMSAETLEIYIGSEFISSLSEKGLELLPLNENGTTLLMYPRGLGKVWMKKVITETLGEAGILAEFDFKNKNGEFEALIKFGNEEDFLIRFKETGKISSGLIAILIDDFGYFWDDRVDELLRMPIPLGIAVIPGHEHSTRIAESAVSQGKEVVLHLPMEPYDYRGGEEEYIIMSGMTESEISGRISRALFSVPGAVGLNNHQGSRVTSEVKIIQRFLAVIRPYDLYFIDSATHASSVGYSEALKMGVPAAKRAVFLDDSEDLMTVENRIHELKNVAQRRGSAIGIGHINAKTISVLKKEIPLIIEEGFNFVYPSQLMN